MRTIGITGGVGSGKSSVCNYIKEKYGALTLISDDIGREMSQPGGGCYDALRALLGSGCFLEDGSLDRKAAGDRAFADPELLSKMNRIIHPAVKEEIKRRISDFEEEGGAIAVIESALLFEAALDELCDETWYIYADREVRLERLLASRPLSLEKAEDIMSAQKSDEFFFERCTRVIDNSGDFRATEIAVDACLRPPLKGEVPSRARR